VAFKGMLTTIHLKLKLFTINHQDSSQKKSNVSCFFYSQKIAWTIRINFQCFYLACIYENIKTCFCFYFEKKKKIRFWEVLILVICQFQGSRIFLKLSTGRNERLIIYFPRCQKPVNYFSSPRILMTCFGTKE
jgi:hypothetical protein